MKYFKAFLNTILPFEYIVYSIKQCKLSISTYTMEDFLDSDLIWTLKIYSFIYIFPIMVSIYFMVLLILGTDEYSFETISNVWKQFFVGDFFGFIMFRVHILWLVVSYIFHKIAS